MLRKNNERMLKSITEQFAQSVIANRKKETFPSQPEAKFKSGTSSYSALNTFQKVNAVITLRSTKEIDNHVGHNLNEKSNAPPTLNVDVSGESKADEPTITIIVPPPKTTHTPPMQLQKPIVHFLNRLKGKTDQAHIDKIKETFSQVKINIPLLDVIQ